MTAPYDTLKLARLATKTDLRDLEQRLKIWTGSIAAAIVAILVAALHLWPPHP